MPNLHTAASEPPAIITSAEPLLIISPASIEWAQLRLLQLNDLGQNHILLKFVQKVNLPKKRYKEEIIFSSFFINC